MSSSERTTHNSERTTHNSHAQSIMVHPSDTFFQPVNKDGSFGLEPMPIYTGHDWPTDQYFGPFLTKGACDWVLACIDNVRESQKARAGLSRRNDAGGEE